MVRVHLGPSLTHNQKDLDAVYSFQVFFFIPKKLFTKYMFTNFFDLWPAPDPTACRGILEVIY
jgi:hypothetical protein